MKIPLIRESNGHPSLCDENDEHKVLGNLVRIIQYVGLYYILFIEV